MEAGNEAGQSRKAKLPEVGESGSGPKRAQEKKVQRRSTPHRHSASPESALHIFILLQAGEKEKP